MTDLAIRLPVACLPVLSFLAALVYLDSYKLVRARTVLLVTLAGAAAAVASWFVHAALAGIVPIPGPVYSRYFAPWIEEILKALVLVALIRGHRVGFLVDAAIFGFAIGTGFALIENLYYLESLAGAHLGVWIVRGFGTAIMHGGATAVFGIASRALVERRPGPLALVPGLLLAVALHSAYNHFFVSPVLSAAAIVVVLPVAVVFVFRRSEARLRRWLDVGFDADTELLELIESGRISDSPVGRYLQSLRARFRGEVVADMLCYLRIHVELALRAKGLLMLRENGFEIALDDDTRERLAELDYLERSIGRTGRLAMLPVLDVSGRELWQRRLLGA